MNKTKDPMIMGPKGWKKGPKGPSLGVGPGPGRPEQWKMPLKGSRWPDTRPLPF